MDNGLVYALFAYMCHVYGRNSFPYTGILFAPVCLFEISLACLAYGASEID